MTSVIQNRDSTLELRRRPLVATKAVGARVLSASRWSRTNAPPCCLSLMHAFRETGGVVSGDSLAMLLRSRSDQPLSLLARWIVNRQVLSFECHSQTLLPMFQFDLAGLTVRPELKPVMVELSDVFDDREFVDWFATPNCWLSGESPVAVFSNDLAAVLQAARADRFVATG